MKNRFLYSIILFFLILSFSNCAKRGNPTGGAKDSIPPVILKTVPENYSTLFNEKEIRIYFDEYIKFNNLQQQLIISPPLKYDPIITPYSTAKYIKIVIIDTLLDNTTYTINFGKSIEDNNEGNAYDYYKYVFSTGDFIDSLTVSGTVKDASLIKPEDGITIMLYEKNEAYTDSTVFSEKPFYITTTKDSTSTFEFTNLKEGNYIMVALKENSSNYTFQPKTDKIGFIDSIISTPNNYNYEITLFKEVLDYKITRPKQISKRQILFGYEGIADSLQLNIISETPKNYSYKTVRDREKDTINYWFKPAIEADSLLFTAINRNKIDTLTIRWRDFEKDSLKITGLQTRQLELNETFQLIANIPIDSIHKQHMTIIDKDSVAVSFSTSKDSIYNLINIEFEKSESNRYDIQFLPNAFVDFYGNVNDTLQYSLNTKKLSDYGTVILNIANAETYPIIVQLTDSKGKVLYESIATKKEETTFELIKPGNYFVRIIYDTNGNGIWDTGNFLKRLQAEIIIYYPEQLEVRPNWTLNETFNLE